MTERMVLCVSCAVVILSVLGTASPLEKELNQVKQDTQAKVKATTVTPQKILKSPEARSTGSSSAPLIDGPLLTDALFSYGDVNNDGRLTLEEIYTFYKTIIGFLPTLAERTAANLILIGDQNKDGVLDWTEIMNAIALMKKEMLGNKEEKRSR